MADDRKAGNRKLIITKQFKKDYQRCFKRGWQIDLLDDVISRILAGEKLDNKHHEHLLGGKYSNDMECHIKFDWVLTYEIFGEFLILKRTGTHQDVFDD